MTRSDLDKIIRQAWRESELRERLYVDVEIEGADPDYLEEVLVSIAFFGFDANRLNQWLNPFRLKSSLDSVLMARAPNIPSPPPINHKDLGKAKR